MKMKHLPIGLLLALLLTSCSSQEEVLIPEALSVPSNCNETKVLESLPPRIAGAKFIDTEWEPIEGTDLFATYNAGGIACTYGIQEAEIGATILWAPDNKSLFAELTPNWISAGQTAIDLPGIDEESAYYLTQGVKGEGEYHIWSVNLLIEGIWIQVGATFFNTLEDAIPVIKAAVNSLRTPELAAGDKLIGCFMAELPDDLYIFNVHYHDNNTIAADIYYKNINGEAVKGLYLGTFTNSIARGSYSFTADGVEIEREALFKADKSGITPATGQVEREGNIEKFKRPLDITWNEKFKYTPAQECEPLLRN